MYKYDTSELRIRVYHEYYEIDRTDKRIRLLIVQELLNANTYMHKYMHIYIHKYMHIYIHTYMHRYIHTFIHIHMRAR